ncbi:MAG: glycogen/starch synthase, partial [Candidatus Omnitrophota bacterium]
NRLKGTIYQKNTNYLYVVNAPNLYKPGKRDSIGESGVIGLAILKIARDIAAKDHLVDHLSPEYISKKEILERKEEILNKLINKRIVIKQAGGFAKRFTCRFVSKVLMPMLVYLGEGKLAKEIETRDKRLTLIDLVSIGVYQYALFMNEYKAKQPTAPKGWMTIFNGDGSLITKIKNVSDGINLFLDPATIDEVAETLGVVIRKKLPDGRLSYEIERFSEKPSKETIHAHKEDFGIDITKEKARQLYSNTASTIWTDSEAENYKAVLWSLIEQGLKIEQRINDPHSKIYQRNLSKDWYAALLQSKEEYLQAKLSELLDYELLSKTEAIVLNEENVNSLINKQKISVQFKDKQDKQHVLTIDGDAYHDFILSQLKHHQLVTSGSKSGLFMVEIEEGRTKYRDYGSDKSYTEANCHMKTLEKGDIILKAIGLASLKQGFIAKDESRISELSLRYHSFAEEDVVIEERAQVFISYLKEGSRIGREALVTQVPGVKIIVRAKEFLNFIPIRRPRMRSFSWAIIYKLISDALPDKKEGRLFGQTPEEILQRIKLQAQVLGLAPTIRVRGEDVALDKYIWEAQNKKKSFWELPIWPIAQEAGYLFNLIKWLSDKELSPPEAYFRFEHISCDEMTENLYPPIAHRLFDEIKQLQEHFKASKSSSPLTFVFVAYEMYPYLKIGGLGDVTFGLPRALADMGHKVYVIIPKDYRVEEEKLGVVDTGVKVNGAFIKESQIYGVKVYLIDRDDFPNIYGLDDIYNLNMSIFFNRTVLATLQRFNIKPDIIYANDWQTALTPMYLKTIYREIFPKMPKIIFMIHNAGAFGYQGIYPIDEFYRFGLDHMRTEVLHIDGMWHNDKLNLLKAGAFFADMGIPVAPTFAKEIQGLEEVEGLDLGGLEKSFSALAKWDRLKGILNGIDTNEWNPATDKDLAYNYDISSIDNKSLNKQQLLKELNWAGKNNIPLIGAIGRITYQKGFDLLANAAERIVKKLKARLVILGSGEDQDTIEHFKALEKRFAGSVRLENKYSEQLARKLYAGLDMVIVPSRWEPCGLVQLIAQRYGTIPIVRATGGLEDTVDETNGFKFKEFDKEALFNAAKQAVSLYADRLSWEKFVKDAMRKDNSWRYSAEKHLQVCEKLLASGSPVVKPASGSPILSTVKRLFKPSLIDWIRKYISGNELKVIELGAGEGRFVAANPIIIAPRSSSPIKVIDDYEWYEADEIFKRIDIDNDKSKGLYKDPYSNVWYIKEYA